MLLIRQMRSCGEKRGGEGLRRYEQVCVSNSFYNIMSVSPLLYLKLQLPSLQKTIQAKILHFIFDKCRHKDENGKFWAHLHEHNSTSSSDLLGQ